MRQFAQIWLSGCLLLVGCDQPSPPIQQSPSTSVNNATTAPSTSTLPDRGPGYRIEIIYPKLESADSLLADALHAYAARERRDFLTNLAQRPDNADAQRVDWILHLEFHTRADTPNWLSVIASGDVYTGGAHGNPLLAGFTLHRPTQRLLGIADLFKTPESGLRALSNFARHSLVGGRSDGDADAARRRIVDGTEPRAENFAEFAIAGRADGIVLFFPPYQIAAYAEGIRELAVPLRVFSASLKPELRDSFSAPPRR